MKSLINSTSTTERLCFYGLALVAIVHLIMLPIWVIPVAIHAETSAKFWAVMSVCATPTLYWGMALHCIDHPRWQAWFYSSIAWLMIFFSYAMYLVFVNAGVL